jgi:flagellar protein FlaG
MSNNTVDPSTVLRPAPKSASSEGLTADYVSKLEKTNKLDPAEKLKSDLQVPDASAMMAEKRLVASNNLEMIHDRLNEIAESLNQEMQIRSKDLQFSVDEITNRFLVTVLDQESGKVVKQIPSETILKVAHNLEALKGILFDDRY